MKTIKELYLKGTRINASDDENNKVGSLVVDVEYIDLSLIRKKVNVYCDHDLQKAMGDDEVKKQWELWLRCEVETNPDLRCHLEHDGLVIHHIRTRRINYRRSLRKK